MSLNETPHLVLPYLAASQAQKHVTHNEALRLVDALVQLAVLNRLTVPPVSPVDGARYIVLPLGTGVFSTQAGKIATYVDGLWLFITPEEGWLAYVTADSRQYVYRAALWQDHIGTAVSSAPLIKIGINTNADATNKLAVKSDAAYLSHDDVTPGTGDARLTLNKSLPAKTTSLLFGTNWSGRAEMGLSGDDNWRIKVSADGSSWKDALIIDAAAGTVRFPFGFIEQNTLQKPSLLIPSTVADLWRSDIDTPASPRNYIVSAIAGVNVTITTNDAGGLFSAGMRNFVMVRIWNISKSPAQAAWVDYDLAANQFRVSNAAHVASWLAGETLRLGDPNPTGTNVLGMIAIDVSRYLQICFGQIFRQRGLKLSFAVQGTGGRAQLDISGSGASGSAFGTFSNSDGSRQSAFGDVFTTELSPISNSNLLFVRETLVGATAMAATRLIRVAGVWV